LPTFEIQAVIKMAASWDAVQMMLGKIWTRLEVIDKLAEAQGKLCQRLDELEKALGRLDPQAAAVISCPAVVTAKTAKTLAAPAKTPAAPAAIVKIGDAKPPAMTSVYDPITKGCKLVTMEQYERHYGKIPAPTYVAMYNPEKQCVDLMFEKHYLESDAYKKDLKARKPKPVPEYTLVYDEKTQEAKLMLWDKFVSKFKPPTCDWAMKYNPKKQGIDLVFWRNYQPGGGYKVLTVNDFF